MPCVECHKPIAVDPVSGLCFNCMTGTGDGGAARKSKWGNEKTVYGGRTYDSKAEADRAAELDLQKRGNAIRAWAAQVTVQLTPEIKYRADFLVCELSGDAYYEDVKGVEAERFRIIRQLWPQFGPLPLHVLKRRKKGGGGWDREIINGKQS